jgi:phosphatidylglycerol lysyltransferase
MVSLLRKQISPDRPPVVEESAQEKLAIESLIGSFLKKASLVLYALVLGGILTWHAVQMEAARHSAGKVVTIALARGPYDLLLFPSKLPQTRAILLFGSGDGGWSGFEETIALTLQDQGYEVIGINSNAYALTDYDLTILQGDFRRIADYARAPFGDRPPPLIVGGWSMGAEQAIAVAGGPHPFPGLRGLLLMDPGSRGRYGLRFMDQVNLEPTGAGTYSMEDFEHAMGNLHIVQWHAADDTFDSRAWLKGLTAPHRELDFANTGHYYTTDRGDFLKQMVASLPWILSSDNGAVTTTGSKP